MRVRNRSNHLLIARPLFRMRAPGETPKAITFSAHALRLEHFNLIDVMNLRNVITDHNITAADPLKYIPYMISDFQQIKFKNKPDMTPYEAIEILNIFRLKNIINSDEYHTAIQAIPLEAKSDNPELKRAQPSDNRSNPDLPDQSSQNDEPTISSPHLSPRHRHFSLDSFNISSESEQSESNDFSDNEYELIPVGGDVTPRKTLTK